MTRLPFTLIFLTIMICANALAGTLGGSLPEHALSGWGISHLSVLEGDLFRLFTGTFLSHDLAMALRQFVFAACVIGTFEWLQGSRRALAMFFSIDVVGTLVVLFAILPALVHVHPSFETQELAVYDVGMSAGGFGLIGALVALQRYRWPLLVAICAAIFIKVWISFDPIADSAHLFCLLLGFVVQAAIISRARKRDIEPN